MCRWEVERLEFRQPLGDFLRALDLRVDFGVEQQGEVALQEAPRQRHRARAKTEPQSTLRAQIARYKA